MTLDAITLDVAELANLSRIEQARLVEDAERRIDDIQRSITQIDHETRQWIEQQRRHIVDTLQTLYEN
jgi:uncharacterized protein YicC (UPF0701 family)